MTIRTYDFTKSEEVRRLKFQFRVKVEGLDVVDFEVLGVAASTTPTFNGKVRTADGWPMG